MSADAAANRTNRTNTVYSAPPPSATRWACSDQTSTADDLCAQSCTTCAQSRFQRRRAPPPPRLAKIDGRTRIEKVDDWCRVRVEKAGRLESGLGRLEFGAGLVNRVELRRPVPSAGRVEETLHCLGCLDFIVFQHRLHVRLPPATTNQQGVPSRQQSHSCWIVCGARGHRNGDIGGETTWSLSRRSSTTAGSNSPNHRFPGSVAPAGTWAARPQSSRG